MCPFSFEFFFFLFNCETVQLHNALIISLFDATATLKRPPSPPPLSNPKPPPTKRRRTLLPYQGPGVPDEQRAIRSLRLKRWALTMGKKERERLKVLQNASPIMEPPRPRRDMDEIASERGVELLPERGGMFVFQDIWTQYHIYVAKCLDPAGSRLPIHLHSRTRAPTLQHVADRMNLICAQNNLSAPSRGVPHLMTLACEVSVLFHHQLFSNANLSQNLGETQATNYPCTDSLINLHGHKFYQSVSLRHFLKASPLRSQASYAHRGFPANPFHRITCRSA